jgi:hypothetical protein
MYKNDFVAVVKNNGKILREDKSTVFLPFGCEYSLLMKNLRARKALVSVSIDGQDVGAQLIINGNSEIELERFIEDLDQGNRFKYIQKTEKIQEHRGDKIDDGIIRIEFQYEREVVYPPLVWSSPITYHYDKPWNSGTITCNNATFDCSTAIPKSITTNSVNNSTNVSGSTSELNGNAFSANKLSKSCLRGSALSESAEANFAVLDSLSELPLQDEGITVKGSVSDQKFRRGYIGVLEDEKHVITLQLKGYKPNGSEIVEPITVKTKKVCETCGTKNEGTAKFCKECGTFLN